MEVEMDATWCYMEISNLPTISKLEIGNQILLECFEDQSNLVHVNCKNATQSLYFRKGFVQDLIEF